MSFFGEDGPDLVSLDVADPSSVDGPKFEDREWRKYIRSLRPLAVEISLNTRCNLTLQRRSKLPHCKDTRIANYCRCKPSKESTLPSFPYGVYQDNSMLLHPKLGIGLGGIRPFFLSADPSSTSY